GVGETRGESAGVRCGRCAVASRRAAAARKPTRGERADRPLGRGTGAVTPQVAYGAHSPIPIWAQLLRDRRTARGVIQHGQEISGARAGPLPTPARSIGMML